MRILPIVFWLAHVFGIGACAALALGLLTGALYEPRLWLKDIEVWISVIGVMFLTIDVLNIFPHREEESIEELPEAGGTTDDGS